MRTRLWLISMTLVLGWTPAHGTRIVIDKNEQSPALDLRLPDQDFANEDQEPLEDWEKERRQTTIYRNAYLKAHAEARAALRQGNATIFIQAMGFGISILDPETGLSAEIIAACVMTDERLGQLEGNNNAVHAWIKKQGVPANSLLRWKEELSDLPSFFEAKSKAGATIPLRPGGPNLKSPDGRFTIRPLAIQIPPWEHEKILFVSVTGLEVSDRGVVLNTLQERWQESMMDLAWGPAGAPFAVVKFQEKDVPAYCILHFQPVDWLSGGHLSWLRYLKDHPEAR